MSSFPCAGRIQSFVWCVKGVGCGFYLNFAGEDPTSVIDGFSLTNGVGESSEEGILVSSRIYSARLTVDGHAVTSKVAVAR